MPVLQAELLNQGFYGMPHQLRNLALICPVVRKVNVGVLVAVAANTSAEQTVAAPGLLVGDFVSVVKPSFQAGLGVVNARVSAANTLAITFSNLTIGALTPTASEIYLVLHASATAT